jgi:hypothetical protein
MEEIKKITRKQIDRVIDKLNKQTDNPFEFIQDELTYAQPEIFDFINETPDINDEEHEFLMHTAQLGWYIISNILKQNVKISSDFLYEQYGRNFLNHQENLLNKSMSDYEVWVELYNPNNQPCLMDYLVDLILNRVQNADGLVRNETLPNIIVVVKTVIDCLVLDENKELAETCDKRYSEKNFNSVKKSADDYVEQFKKSSLFMKLKHHEKKETQLVISAFSEMMYNYFLTTPVHWNARRALECCTIIMPRKVVAPKMYFNSVEPVLTAFMDFCADKGYVPEGKTIARRLRGVTEIIIRESENSEFWGIGKELLRNAESSGVNLSDSKELEEFLKNYKPGNRSPRELKSSFENIKPGRNDSCPCGSGKKYKKCCGLN